MKISSSPRAAVHTSQGSSGSEESVALLGGISEEPTAPPHPQEAVNPQQKVIKKNFPGRLILL